MYQRYLHTSSILSGNNIRSPVGVGSGSFLCAIHRLIPSQKQTISLFICTYIQAIWLEVFEETKYHSPNIVCTSCQTSQQMLMQCPSEFLKLSPQDSTPRSKIQVGKALSHSLQSHKRGHGFLYASYLLDCLSRIIMCSKKL